MMDDAAFLWDLDALQPGRKSFRHVLLPESGLPDAGGVAFHRDRPAAQVRHHHGRHRFVIGRQIALGNPVVRKKYFLGMRDHRCSLMTSRGALSSRTPSSRGCRSLPWTVHSIKATWTTIS